MSATHLTAACPAILLAPTVLSAAKWECEVEAVAVDEFRSKMMDDIEHLSRINIGIGKL